MRIFAARMIFTLLLVLCLIMAGAAPVMGDSSTFLGGMAEITYPYEEQIGIWDDTGHIPYFHISASADIEMLERFSPGNGETYWQGMAYFERIGHVEEVNVPNPSEMMDLYIACNEEQLHYLEEERHMIVNGFYQEPQFDAENHRLFWTLSVTPGYGYETLLHVERILTRDGCITVEIYDYPAESPLPAISVTPTEGNRYTDFADGADSIFGGDLAAIALVAPDAENYGYPEEFFRYEDSYDSDSGFAGSLVVLLGIAVFGLGLWGKFAPGSMKKAYRSVRKMADESLQKGENPPEEASGGPDRFEIFLDKMAVEKEKNKKKEHQSEIEARDIDRVGRKNHREQHRAERKTSANESGMSYYEQLRAEEEKNAWKDEEEAYYRKS